MLSVTRLRLHHFVGYKTVDESEDNRTCAEYRAIFNILPYRGSAVICVIGLKTSLKIPSHFKYVATLRREICGIFLTNTVQFVLHSLIIIPTLLVSTDLYGQPNASGALLLERLPFALLFIGILYDLFFSFIMIVQQMLIRSFSVVLRYYPV